MAVPSQLEDTALEAADAGFLQQSELTYIIPSGTEVDVKEEIERAISKKQPLEEIESRTWLFFGKEPPYLALPYTPLKFSCLTILIHRCQMKPSMSSSY